MYCKEKDYFNLTKMGPKNQLNIVARENKRNVYPIVSYQ